MGKERGCDVAVVGSGPAGAAIAIALARKGLSVAVLSRSRTGPAIGETVPPSIIRPLARLGLWESFLAAGHAQADGTVVAWGEQQPFENDYVFNAYGPGWHIDRDDFDAMLVSAARDAGADIYPCRVRACLPIEGSGWMLSTSGSGDTANLRARWVVDATGRAGWLSRRRGATRHSLDRLVSLVKFLPANSIRETRTLIEASEFGWWYAARLPRNRAVVAYFSDADLLPPDKRAHAALWRDRFARTGIIADICKDSPDHGLHYFAASSARMLPCGGARWIAVGDAASCYDPLSGQGITKALTSASNAAECIFERLDDGAEPKAFCEMVGRDFDQYLQFRNAHYARETRWQDGVFWHRRSRALSNKPPSAARR
jgi:flavin-dependent dehydrogenase